MESAGPGRTEVKSELLRGASATEIRFEGISKVFEDRTRGTVRAVQEVNFEARPGELVTLLGPSGCGKTTLLRMVAGFEEPTTGRIVIGGKDQTNVLANQRDIGFVFQNYALFPHLNVFDNVAYGLKLRRMASAKIRSAVEEVLELVGLVGMERRFQNQLSGGEQQRVALARVIVMRPRVLLFDEPLSNLDAKRRIQMREEIRELQRALSITSLYVTHDQEEALAISDRIVVMNRGSIEQVGSPLDVYAHPGTEFVANFVGRTNVLRATNVRSEQGRAVVEALGREFTLPPGEPAGRPGLAATVFVRPEAIRIVPRDSASAGALGGTVRTVVYLGEKVEYTVDVSGTVLKVTAYDPQKYGVFGVGGEVAVELSGERMSLGRGAPSENPA